MKGLIKKLWILAVAAAFLAPSAASAASCHYEGSVPWEFDTTYNAQGMHFWNSGNTPQEFTLGMSSVNTGLGMAYTGDWQYVGTMLVSPTYDDTMYFLDPTMPINIGATNVANLALVCPAPVVVTPSGSNILIDALDGVAGDGVSGTSTLFSGSVGQIVIALIAVSLAGTILGAFWYLKRRSEGSSD